MSTPSRPRRSARGVALQLALTALVLMLLPAVGGEGAAARATPVSAEADGAAPEQSARRSPSTEVRPADAVRPTPVALPSVGAQFAAPGAPSGTATAPTPAASVASTPAVEARPVLARLDRPAAVRAPTKKKRRVSTACRRAPEKGTRQPPKAPAGKALAERLGLAQAWDLSRGDGVTIGVVDSGVDDRHPGLTGAVERAGEIVTVRTKKGFRTQSSRAPALDCEGHGTAVAGLLVARSSAKSPLGGVAPQARVRAVRVADGVENVSGEALAAAIDRAVTGGVKVLNLSFALPVDRPEVRRAVRRALAADVLVVAAAGNDGEDGGRRYPAAYDGVLAVGAVAPDGQPLRESPRGDWIDLAAYGAREPVLASGGSGFHALGGTSFATPQVAAAAALVRARFPGLDADEVAARLVASAAATGGGRDPRTGAGIVDPFGALTQLGGGAGDSAGAEEAGEAAAVPVQPLPAPQPLLAHDARAAVVTSGVLLFAVLLALLGAPAIRRAARRGWRAGPRAGPPSPPTPAAGLPATVLDRLTGPPARPDPARHGDRQRRTPPTPDRPDQRTS